MNSQAKTSVAALAALLVFSAPGWGQICEGFGPQTPRDIDSRTGENPVIFSVAPDSQRMNLCNIHFHKQAEHKAADYSIPGGDGEFGGFRCNDTEGLELAELRPLTENQCSNVGAGDTVEVHWVYTSCDVAPGPTLGSCLDPDACPNPTLRVEAQVFLLVNDSSAADFADFDSAGRTGGYFQPKALPSGTGEPVVFLGSTTGPKFTSEACSPLQVSWSVRPECAKLDVGSLSEWCGANLFEESGAQGVRRLVEDPKLLSEIRK